MQAHDGSIQMHSPSGSNNQQGGEGTSQTSDNAVKNRSLLTRCCCKPVRALAGAVSTEPSYHVPACQSCGTASGESIPLSIALSMVGCGSALLDAKSSTKFLHQGGCKVHTPITQ